MAEYPLPKDAGDFRLVDRKVLDAFNALPEKNKYVRGLVAWLGYSQAPIEYDRRPRLAGTSKYPLKKMVQLARNALFGFSKKPLRLATNLGLGGLVAGFLLVLWILASWWWHIPGLVRGWSSLLTAVIFFSSVQLLCVGLIGEYLGQVFDEVKNRPSYVVDRVVCRHQTSVGKVSLGSERRG
jgi:dolichol-phosphate mannosyltransferase